MGCRIQRGVAVTGLEQTSNDQWIVTTPNGAITCEVVLNAAGYRAGEVMALVGRHLPIATLSHQYLVTEELPELAAPFDPAAAASRP